MKSIVLQEIPELSMENYGWEQATDVGGRIFGFNAFSPGRIF